MKLRTCVATTEILELFGEYDRALDMISERVFHGDLCGEFSIMVYKNDLDEITEDMEEYFGEDDEYEIYVEWDLEIR